MSDVESEKLPLAHVFFKKRVVLKRPNLTLVEKVFLLTNNKLWIWLGLH